MEVITKEQLKLRLRIDDDRALSRLLVKLKIKPITRDRYIWEAIEQSLYKKCGTTKPGKPSTKSIGRPKIPEDQRRIQITGTVKNVTRRKLRKYCTQRNLSISRVIEDAINFYLRSA